MTRKECCDQCIKPPLKNGDQLSSGNFFRNLKGDELKAYYYDDKPDNPVHGHRVHHSMWKNAKGSSLSVNSIACIVSAKCSLVMSNADGRHEHVLEINFAALKEFCRQELVAVYDPIESPEPENGCHFDIQGMDNTTEFLHELTDLFKADYPPCKMPSKRDPDKGKAKVEAKAAYDRIFRFHPKAIQN